MLHGNELAILSFHHFATDNVTGRIFFIVNCAISCLEMTNLTLGSFHVGFGLLLGLNLGNDSGFKFLVLAASSGNFISRVFTSSIVKAGRAHNFRLGFTVDTVGSAVKNFVSVNGVFEVQVLLRNMFSHNGPIVKRS